MTRGNIKQSLMEFKNALGVGNFSNELSETEFKLLSLVADAQNVNNNINLTTISSALNVTRSAVTQMVNKLVEKNYIEKYTLETNKKEIYLKIGKNAYEQYNIVMEKMTLFFERLFEAIGPEGVENLQNYLDIAKQIGENLKKECEIKC